MNEKSNATGIHHAKQPILTHSQVVEAIAKRTGVSVEDTDRVLCQLPILFEDSYLNIVGLRISGLGTLRNRLLPGRDDRVYTGSNPRIKNLQEKIRRDRMVPEFILDRGFMEKCKDKMFFISKETMMALGQEKLKKILSANRTSNYVTPEKYEDPLEGNDQDHEQRRFQVKINLEKVA